MGGGIVAGAAIIKASLFPLWVASVGLTGFLTRYRGVILCMLNAISFIKLSDASSSSPILKVISLFRTRSLVSRESSQSYF